MRMLRTIKAKIALSSGLCLLITCTALALSSSSALREQGIAQAEGQLRTLSRQIGAQTKVPVQEALRSARGLAQTLEAINDESILLDIGRDEISGILRKALVTNEDFVSVFTCWEVDALDGLDVAYQGVEGHDASGRFHPVFHRAGEAILVSPLSEHAPELLAEEYVRASTTGTAVLSEPVVREELLTSTWLVPIRNGDEFFGVVGVEFDLGFVQALVASESVFDGAGGITILGGDHLVLGDNRGADPGSPALRETHPTDATLSRLAQGEVVVEQRGGDLVSCALLAFEGGGTPWFACVEVPFSVVTAGASRQAWAQVGIGAVGILLGSLFLWGLAVRISKPIQRLTDLVEDIARGGGDLTRRLESGSQDELGALARAFNHFVAQIHDLVLDVRDSTGLVERSSLEIARSSDEMNSRTQEQAANLQEITAALSEVSVTTRDNSKSAEEASSISGETSDAAREGLSETAGMVEAMDRIRESASDISRVIQVIDGIAFQTNLLALNAAVEAARAGEAGKGFAVVAEEVRNLAHRSAEAARSTGDMIGESTRRAEDGAQRAQQVSDSLERIASRVEQVSALVSDIAVSSNQQAASVGEITRGVTTLDEVVQSGAADAANLASGAETTQIQVTGLRELVGRFRVEDRTATGAGASAPATSPATSPGRAPAPPLPSTPAPQTVGIPLAAMTEPEELLGIGDTDLESF